jgi:hypothetical protein
MLKYIYFHIGIILLFLSSCSKDGEKPKPVKETNCITVELSSTSAMPFDSLFINKSGFKSTDKTTVEFWDKGVKAEAFMSVETSPSGKLFILAPFHPTSPLEGGSLSVIFKNEANEAICEPVNITINALPKADNYTSEISQALLTLIEQRMAYLNFDMNLIKGDLANLPAELVPFAISYNLLNNAQNDNSLIPFLKNDKLYFENSLDKKSSIDLSNRLLNRFGILELIKDDIASFSGRVARKMPGQAVYKTSCDGLKPAEIGRQMRVAADAAKYLDPESVKGKKLQQAADASMLSGLSKTLGLTSTVAGLTLFIYKTAYEGVANTYFNRFTKFDFSISPTEFLEETACNPIPYTDVKAGVSTNGWNTDKNLWETLFQIIGLKASQAKITGFFKENSYNISLMIASKQLDNLSSDGHFDGNRFTVEPNACDNINFDDNEFIYGKIIGDAFSVEPENRRVVPQKTGKADLEVGIRSSTFAGNTISKTVSLETKPIQVAWHPNGVVRVKPGSTIDLQANLYAAYTKDIKATSDKGALQKGTFEGTGVANEGIWNYKHFTPSKASDYPYFVTVEHTSKVCLRGKKDAPPRTSIISIVAGLTVEVYSLEVDCLEPGKSRDFDVNVSGENKNVTWSSYSENGSAVAISSAGLFKAPNQEGTYYIVATSQADATVADTMSVDVGNCVCNWDFSGGGLTWAGDNSTFSRVVVPGFIVISLTGERGLFSFQFKASNLPAVGQSKVIDLPQGVKDWILTGGQNLVTVISPSEEDSDGTPNPGPTGIKLEITNNGQTLIGKITGSAVKTDFNSKSQSIIQITINFRAGELNPAEGLFGCD